ncbi:hypothetical protein LPJ63_002898 [Coemansia sp. RSA 2711]|nr:hypothetical protein LPJ63_002898 [Coemansia sp. RSA 2711]KAJ2314611.1 hypothetical protein IWW52_004237 [Coemansia sp. RSA 2704]KAJ2382446.1 hypothetical protein H4S02_005744 [Coemansia sp. RSA 2611]KAJ2717709.1 hypothetical protein H4R23_005232 [Coemansia sp. Cherry 401B]
MSTRSLVLDYDFASGKTAAHRSDLSAKDFMLLGGSGVYTAMRTVCGGRRIFLFDDHMQRLSNSHRQVMGGHHEPQYWRELLSPVLRNGLSQVTGESKITVLVGQDRVRVQFATLHGPTSRHCWVRLIDGHREHPEAKDLRWVHEREALERLIAPPVNEVVLVSWHDRRFYEGLSSNFFAVRRVGTGRDPAFRNFELVSAPLDSVLLGTIMKLVLRICERDGIAVAYEPWLELEQWSGAFVTSTSRLVLPVERIVHGEHEQRVDGDNPLVDHLRQSVELMMVEQSVEV